MPILWINDEEWIYEPDYTDHWRERIFDEQWIYEPEPEPEYELIYIVRGNAQYVANSYYNARVYNVNYKARVYDVIHTCKIYPGIYLCRYCKIGYELCECLPF